MVKNSLYKNGTVVCVWVDADTRKEALENHWSFWNHGATSAPDMHWTGVSKGYFWSDEKRLRKYFKNSSRAIVLNELGEDWQGDATTGPQVSKDIVKLSEKRFSDLWASAGHRPMIGLQCNLSSYETPELS